MDADVMIAAPVRNRAWVLPSYLAALAALEYPQDRLRYYFLVNDCSDASEAILRSWCASRPRAEVEVLDTGVAGWNRYANPHYDYGNLARLRNHILDRFLQSGASHLFGVDSDVLVPPAALAQLLLADKPAVAGVIANLPGLSIEASPAHNFLFRAGNLYRHEPTVPDGPFEVDLTGAVILIRREVPAAGVRYEGRRWGEDAGFCENARAAGFRLWCHGGVRCDHRMDDPAQPGLVGMRQDSRRQSYRPSPPARGFHSVD